MISFKDRREFTSSPPGRLTDVSGKNASSVELISTRHRFDSTAVILPTTTSPTSPIYLKKIELNKVRSLIPSKKSKYLVLIGWTRNKLLTLATYPITDAYLLFSVV